MWLSDRFPGLMLWHMVAALAAVFAAKALLYWAADWLVLVSLLEIDETAPTHHQDNALKINGIL